MISKKKRILFINHSLHSGGIEKSLVTLLSLFDYDAYDVDLQLFVHDGLFMDRIPQQVNLLPPFFPATYKWNIRKAFWALLKQGRPRLAFGRLRVTIAGMSGTMGERLAKMWNIEKQFIPSNDTVYDAVIAFMEGQPIYYAVEKTRSANKIGFIHGDYRAMKLDQSFDAPFLDKLEAVCTVSPACKTALDECFPIHADRHHVIYNILSSSFLREMAQGQDPFGAAGREERILSIARLSYQKGLDLAIEAFAQLKQDGVKFRWSIIGIGPEEESLRSLMAAKGLEEGRDVVFLGEQSNPYPYLKNCSIYLQPSRFEGKSIAVDEAMVLCRPILLTNFSTAADQIESDQNGLIVEMSPAGLVQGLKKMLGEPALCERYVKALEQVDYSNEQEIEKLYTLINKGAE